jgi:hypothetical protein
MARKKRRYGDVAGRPSRGSSGRSYKGAIHYRIKRRTSDYDAYVCLAPGKTRGIITARALDQEPGMNAKALRMHGSRCGSGWGRTPTSALRDGMKDLLTKMR